LLVRQQRFNFNWKDRHLFFENDILIFAIQVHLNQMEK